MDRARILVVDDTPSNLEILAELLSDEHQVITVLDGETALRMAFSEHKPDLVLLDVMMPGTDGYQVCSALKADPRTSAIPVIFVTARSEQGDEEHGFHLGAADYITKPFQPGTVKARVRTHLALYNHNRALEGLVAERTVELERARAEAERANRAKSVFLSNMSHELRTPLNGILGMTQLLTQGAQDEDQRTFLSYQQDSAARLLVLVNDLLELSDIEARAVTLRPEEFALRPALEDFVALYRKQAQDKGLDFRLSMDPSVPERLTADLPRVRQVLMNLMNNALRYTEKGEVSLGVTCWQDARVDLGQGGVPALCLTVADTGIGIAPEQCKMIFEPFVIGEDYLTKRFSGAGLGLSISKRLVEFMGGRIWLESEEGRGTVVSFTVPCPLDCAC